MIQYVCAWNRDNKVLNVNKVSRVWVKDKKNFFCNSKITNKRTNWTTRPGLYTYDKVRNRKKCFEIPVFLPIEQGMSPE